MPAECHLFVIRLFSWRHRLVIRMFPFCYRSPGATKRNAISPKRNETSARRNGISTRPEQSGTESEHVGTVYEQTGTASVGNDDAHRVDGRRSVQGGVRLYKAGKACSGNPWHPTALPLNH